MSTGTNLSLVMLAMLLVVACRPAFSFRYTDIFEQFENTRLARSATVATSKATTPKQPDDGIKDHVDEDDTEDSEEISGETDLYPPAKLPQSCVADMIQKPGSPLELAPKLQQELKPPSNQFQGIKLPTQLLSELGTRSESIPLFGSVIKSLKTHTQTALSTVSNTLGRVIMFIRDQVALFETKRAELMQQAQTVITATNSKIRQFFENQFVEYRDLCVPDQEKCLRDIQQRMQAYETEIQKNVNECQDDLGQQLDEHRELVNGAQKAAKRPYRKVSNCFDVDGSFLQNSLACNGNILVNVAQVSTDSMQQFANKLSDISQSLSKHVGKFENCVAQRKRLMARNEKSIATDAKSCFKRQSR